MTHNEFETYLQELEPKLAGMTFTVKILFFKILTMYQFIEGDHENTVQEQLDENHARLPMDRRNA
jgi:hypothetical protein